MSLKLTPSLAELSSALQELLPSQELREPSQNEKIDTVSQNTYADDGYGSLPGAIYSNCPSETLLYSLRDTISKTLPPSLSKTLEKIKEVESIIISRKAALAKERQKETPQALTLSPVKQVEREHYSTLGNALFLENAVATRQEKAAALDKAITFTTEDNDINALETLSHVKERLEFFERINHNAATPFAWQHVDACLKRKKSLPLISTRRTLGKGAEATVTKVTYENKSYALKRFFSQKSDNPKQKLLNSEHEAEIALRFAGHPHIQTPLLGDQNSLLYELASGSLLDLVENFLSNKVTITPANLKMLFTQIADALNYMHSLDYAHRDLKLENVLLFKSPSGNFSIKISDPSYAASTQDKEALADRVGTPASLSKELARAYEKKIVLTGISYKRADVYAFGMMIFDFLSQTDIQSPIVTTDSPKGKLPSDAHKLFHTRSYFKPLTASDLKLLMDPVKMQALDPSEELFNLMCDCLQDNAAMRPTMDQIYNNFTSKTH